MRVATTEEQQEYIRKAEIWLTEALVNVGMFWDHQIACKIAVAEYMANQDGLSLWEHHKDIKGDH